MRRLAEIFFQLLARYGADLRPGPRTGSGKQLRQLLSGKLPVGHREAPGEQPAREPTDRNAGRLDDNFSGCGLVPGQEIDAALSDSQRLAFGQTVYSGEVRQSRVFDILNAGPRHRFVVLGEGGPFIVHNCVQATARDVMAHAVVNLEAAGYPVVLRVHDEIASEVPEGVGSVEEFERIMATLPAWCADWPIRAAGGWRGSRYKKD